MNEKPAIWFVTGTDTEIGKTFCAAALARGLVRQGRRVGVYKPVASGCVPDANGDLVAEDAVQLWDAAGRPGSLQAVCPQRFRTPLAPPQAAARESRVVDAAGLVDNARTWLSGDVDVVVVEGAGGLFSPIAGGMLNVDLLKQLAPARVWLVAPNRLGVISAVVANVRAAVASNVRVSDLILNQIPNTDDASMDSNAHEIGHWLSLESGATPRVHSMPVNGTGEFFLPDLKP
ncbi:MAG: dethiobiotin synthase [Planctomycetota bacterium]